MLGLSPVDAVYSTVYTVTTVGFQEPADLGTAGKVFVTLAIGCTGGKHRSVTVAEQIGLRLAGIGADVQVTHRDLGRE